MTERNKDENSYPKKKFHRIEAEGNDQIRTLEFQEAKKVNIKKGKEPIYKEYLQSKR